MLYGDTAPLPKTGRRAPKFSAYLYCGQTAGCIKIPLGMEVDLSPGDFVLDGAQPRAPPQKGAEVNLCPGYVVLDGVAALP